MRYWIRPNARALRNHSDLVPAPNDNLDQIILTLESSDHTNLKFYSTKLVCDHCGITDRTFRKWCGKLAPSPEQKKPWTNNRNLFRIDYLKILFDNFAEKEVREKLETINDVRENLDPNSGTGPEDPENKITKLELALEIIKSDKQTIDILQKQVDLANKFWPELFRTQNELLQARNELAKSQNELLETKKQLTLTQNWMPNWLISLLARIRPNKPK